MYKLIVWVGSTAMLLITLILTTFNGIIVDADVWRERAKEVLGKSEAFISSMKDAETGQLGYLLTGNKTYLEPFLSSKKNTLVQLDELRRLTEDNPAQQQHIVRLAPLVDAKLSEMSLTIELYSSQHTSEALAIVNGNAGKNTMNSIRAIVNDFNHKETNLLAKLDVEYFSQLRYFSILLFSLLALTFSMIFIFAYMARREFRERIRIQAEEEKKIHDLAFYDTLTQLPNRRMLNDRLSQAIVTSKRSGLYGALMFLDLDNFKPLNDTYGHDVGDILLIEVAQRISSCVREMDTVARFGGDEFIVMLNELDRTKTKSTKQACVVSEKIRDTLSKPYMLKTRLYGKADMTIEHHCMVSIGVVLFLGQEASKEDIIKRADLAMYQAKYAGRNQVQFYDTIDPAR